MYKKPIPLPQGGEHGRVHPGGDPVFTLPPEVFTLPPEVFTLPPEWPFFASVFQFRIPIEAPHRPSAGPPPALHQPRI